MAEADKLVPADLMDAEEARPAPGAPIYEVGDLIEGLDGKSYLVTWANALPDGTPLDRVSTLQLADDLRSVTGDAMLLVDHVASLTRKSHLDFDTTRKLHWGWFAGLLPR